MWIFLDIKGSNHLILVGYVEYRVGFRGIYGGMTLYHIGYVRCRKTPVECGTNGVTCDCKIRWYLIGIIVWPKVGFMTWVICKSFSNKVVVVGIIGW